MKLNALRGKDITHVEILDDLGLITSSLEAQLPPVLRERLRTARERIAADQPDIEG